MMSAGDEDMPGRTADRVCFADGETDSMPVEWADRFIRWVYANRPDVFITAMQRGVFRLDTPVRGRPRS
jgi:hypothetical protein